MRLLNKKVLADYSFKNETLFEEQSTLEFIRSVTYGMPRAQVQQLWRNLTNQHPDVESFANQFSLELMLSDEWSELERFLKIGVKRFPSSQKLRMRYIDSSLVRGDADAALSRLAALPADWKETPDRAVRRYAALLLKRKFAAAERYAAKLLARSIIPGDEAVLLCEQAAIYKRLRSGWKFYRYASSDYATFVINLDQDTARLERTTQQLGARATFSRIPGVKGAYLPDQQAAALTKGLGAEMRGTIGCFLSHIRAWECGLNTAFDHYLVLEDDAMLIAGLPSTIAALELPANYDVCFINERMAPADFNYRARSSATMPAAISIDSKSANWTSAGTDGYFISRKGATKLLDMLERDCIAGDIDWRLVYYSLTSKHRSRLIARGGFLAQALLYHGQSVVSTETMKNYVLVPPLVRQFSGGSVRLWDNKLQHAHLAGATAALVKRQDHRLLVKPQSGAEKHTGRGGAVPSRQRVHAHGDPVPAPAPDAVTAAEGKPVRSAAAAAAAGEVPPSRASPRTRRP
jgi:GR25 family glycosyltransferase involved in LPS biosynthesis